jgi:hypothetical protein
MKIHNELKLKTMNIGENRNIYIYIYSYFNPTSEIRKLFAININSLTFRSTGNCFLI